MAKPAKKIMVQGHGPSRLLRDPAASNDPYRALRGLHVHGKPIEELSLAQVLKLSYQHTDEGIEARNRGKSESAARVTQSPLEKSIEQRRDFRENTLEVWEAPDPMKDVAEAHVAPGMIPKFLNPDKCDRDGTRGFEVVKDKHGDPVKLGRMLLAQMPVERAKARNEHYRKKGAERLQRIEQKNQERQRELVA